VGRDEGGFVGRLYRVVVELKIEADNVDQARGVAVECVQHGIRDTNGALGYTVGTVLPVGPDRSGEKIGSRRPVS